jgi:hypothetical protein
MKNAGVARRPWLFYFASYIMAQKDRATEEDTFFTVIRKLRLKELC